MTRLCDAESLSLTLAKTQDLLCMFFSVIICLSNVLEFLFSKGEITWNLMFKISSIMWVNFLVLI